MVGNHCRLAFAMPTSRSFQLLADMNKKQIIFNQGFEDQTMSVLFENEAPKSKANSPKTPRPGTQLWGKSPWLQSVIVDVSSEEEAKKYFGKIASVKILKSRPSSLVGVLV